MKLPNRNKWVGLYSVLIIVFMTSHFLLGLDVFDPTKKYIPFLEKLTLAIASVSIVLLVRTVLEKLIDKLNHEEGERYNLRRILRFVAAALIVLVATSFLFQKPYTALAGLGLVSLTLGFALQAPITSFIAWLYIIFRRPYRVGDRIEIGEHRGDVVEISYLDTIIQECSGDYLGNDRLSGRVIHFPNSIILTGKVINYSGQFIPFIWNETAVQISYTSDLKFVESCLLEAAAKDFAERYPNQIKEENEPAVYFRVNTFAWLEAVISYPVEPTDTTGRRNRVLRYALPLLNAAPDKVGFPEGTKR